MTRNELLSQYETVRTRGGWLTRPERGLIEVRGPDRAAWLNNLVTNVIKTLRAGDGNYAFAVNIKGRVVFDLNMLIIDEPSTPDGRIWLDIDAGWIDAAMTHLNKYIITENVTLTNISKSVARLAWLGPQSKGLVERMGWGNLAAMPALQHAAVSGPATVGGSSGGAADCVDGNVTAPRLLRHDFAGLIGAELFVPAGELSQWQEQIVAAARALEMIEVDASVIDTLRIEAGIPASRRDIDAEVVPPETGQIERGISYHKGCYLGQEVIERMRSHGILPRKLVGLKLGSGTGVSPVIPDTIEVVAPPLTLKRDDNEVGRITSTCWSPAINGVLGLGYLKSAYLTANASFAAQPGNTSAEVISLPVRPA